MNLNNYFAGGIYGIYLVIATLVVFYHISLAKVYEKAGIEGWKAYIPFYNVIPFIKISRRPKWWLYIYILSVLLIISIIFLHFWWLYTFLLIPLIFGILISIDFAKAFDQQALFGLGILFMPFVFIPILAYSDAQPVAFREKDFEE